MVSGWPNMDQETFDKRVQKWLRTKRFSEARRQQEISKKQKLATNLDTQDSNLETEKGVDPLPPATSKDEQPPPSSSSPVMTFNTSVVLPEGEFLVQELDERQSVVLPIDTTKYD